MNTGRVEGVSRLWRIPINSRARRERPITLCLFTSGALPIASSKTSVTELPKKARVGSDLLRRTRGVENNILSVMSGVVAMLTLMVEEILLARLPSSKASGANPHPPSK